MRQIVLDTETTGLEPKQGHKIIEIGCIELINRRHTGNTFHHYINPEREVEQGALKVHGITNAFLMNKPIFAEIYDEFLEFVNGAKLIIHNAPFDVGFLNHEFLLLNRKNKSIDAFCEIFDTLTLARKLHPGQRNSLDALCKRYGVNNSNRKLHGALLDAKILADVYLAMTGGQENLFAEYSEQKSNQSQGYNNPTSIGTQAQSKINKAFNLPVIKASDEDVHKHQKFLESIKKG